LVDAGAGEQQAAGWGLGNTKNFGWKEHGVFYRAFSFVVVVGFSGQFETRFVSGYGFSRTEKTPQKTGFSRCAASKPGG
jgi:hypothetical protein